jgi:hypothetical protein
MPVRSPTNEHEAIVGMFSRLSLGAINIFHPDLYHKGKEPADMIFLNRRSIIVFYMTTIGRSFEKASIHNFDQAKKQLRLWKKGCFKITGSNQFRKFDVSYNDVDNILVIGVVGGKVEASQLHLDSVGWDHKIKAVATIASSTLFRIARMGGGVRDILAFVKKLPASGEVLSCAHARWHLEQMEEGAHEAARSRLAQANGFVRPKSRHREFAVKTLREILLPVRGAPGAMMGLEHGVEIASDILPDLDIRDIANMTFGIAAGKATLDSVPKGKYGPSEIMGNFSNPAFNFGLLVSRQAVNGHALIQLKEKYSWRFCINLSIVENMTFPILIADRSFGASAYTTELNMWNRAVTMAEG